jgi:hypothetical protein
MSAAADALMGIFGFKRVEGEIMKTDRELLELAARAAGIVGVWHERGQCIHVTDCAGMSDMWWRPLTDDGDALRLAVELRLNFTTGDLACAASWPPHKAWVNEVVEAHQDNRASATRRAIVRAAAAIGEQMK